MNDIKFNTGIDFINGGLIDTRARIERYESNLSNHEKTRAEAAAELVEKDFEIEGYKADIQKLKDSVVIMEKQIIILKEAEEASK